MAGKFDQHAFSQGDIMRRQAETERALRDQQTARRLAAAAVGRGGVRVHSGGSVRIQDGGGVDVLDGGNIQARYPNGRPGIQYGSLTFQTGTGAGHGLLVEDDDESDNNIFRARRDPEGSKLVEVGSASSRPIFFATTDLTQILGVGGLVMSLNVAPGAAAIGFGDLSRVLFMDGDGLFLVTPDTTASSANVNMTEAGFIARVTSRAASKVDVQDLDIDPSDVLALRPRTWRDRSEVEREPDTDRWHVGLVAEEVESAGLAEFVDYDEDGQPQSIAYDRLVVALLSVVQEQQQRLDALDGGSPGRRSADARDRKPKRRPMKRQQLPPVVKPDA